MVLPAPAAVPPIVLLGRAAVDLDAGAVAKGVHAGDIGADQVAFDQCAGRVRKEPDARGGIGRDDVAVAGCRAADRDAGGAAHDHAESRRCPGPRFRCSRCRCGCPGARRPSWRSPRSTRPPVALAEITLPTPCAVPPMVTPGGIVNRHARARVGQGLGSGLVRADVVALDQGVRRRLRRCRCRRPCSRRSSCQPDRPAHRSWRPFRPR